MALIIDAHALHFMDEAALEALLAQISEQQQVTGVGSLDR